MDITDGDGETVHTSRHVSAKSHCTNADLLQKLHDASRVASRNRERAQFLSNLLLTMYYSSPQDDTMEMLKKLIVNPTSQSFFYALMNPREMKFDTFCGEANDLMPAESMDMVGECHLWSECAAQMRVDATKRLSMKDFDVILCKALNTEIESNFTRMSSKMTRACVSILRRMVTGEDVHRGKRFPAECDGDVMRKIVNDHRSKLGLERLPSYNAAAEAGQRDAARRNKSKKGKGGPNPREKITGAWLKKNPWEVFGFYFRCLQIQQLGGDECSKFHLLPLPGDHSHHKNVTIGNLFFMALIKKHGTEEEKESLKGDDSEIRLKELWRKYFVVEKFEKEETEDSAVVLRFINMIRTDGVSLHIVLKAIYLYDTNNTPRAKSFPTPRVPEEPSRECGTIVGFGKHKKDTFRETVIEDPEYLTGFCYEKTLASGAPLTSQMGRLVAYASGQHRPQLLPPIEPTEDDIPEPSADVQKLLEPMNNWWKDDVVQSDKSKILNCTSRGNVISSSTLRGKWFSVPLCTSIHRRITHDNSIIVRALLLDD